MKLTFAHTLTCGSLQAQVPLGSLLSVEFVNSDLAAAIGPATCLDVAPDLEIEQERELFEAFKAHRRDWIEARGIYAPRTPALRENASGARTPGSERRAAAARARRTA